ncbi:MAG: hypothetical protein H6685_05075 [Deltaproteobacteria bacterium]|nr:hypothetical protein [Deltaproteobacteria bacterium]
MQLAIVAVIVIVGFAVVAGLVLRLWRASDRTEFAGHWTDLWDDATQDGRLFDPFMVDGLPEAARRYLLWAIEPGTPLATRAHLPSSGEFCPKPGGEWWPMTCEGIYAGPRGLAWRASIGKGAMRIEGMDVYAGGEGSMTIWMNDVIPMAHADGDDISRSAAGRAAGECFLVPSTLLPGEGVRWEAMDEETARVHITVDGREHAVTLAIAPDGRPTSLVMPRWSDKTPDGRWGEMSFGADFSGETRVGGYRIPAEVVAGWGYGTDAWPAGAFIKQRFDGGEYR